MPGSGRTRTSTRPGVRIPGGHQVVDNPYDAAAVHGEFGYGDIGDLTLEEGATQRGCRLAYATMGELNAAALGRITAKTFVMPISADKLFPVPDCAAEQELINGSELRVIEDIHGHATLFGLSPSYAPRFDAALTDLLASQV